MGGEFFIFFRYHSRKWKRLQTKAATYSKETKRSLQPATYVTAWAKRAEVSILYSMRHVFDRIRRQADREKGKQAGREKGRQAGRPAGRKASRQAGRQAGREKGNQAGRQTI